MKRSYLSKIMQERPKGERISKKRKDYFMKQDTDIAVTAMSRRLETHIKALRFWAS